MLGDWSEERKLILNSTLVKVLVEVGVEVWQKVFYIGMELPELIAPVLVFYIFL